MNPRRITQLLVVGLALATVLCLCAAVRLVGARDTALAAQEELAGCTQLARTLAVLKSGPVSRETLAQLLPVASAALTDASARASIAADAVQVGQPFPGSGMAIGLPLRLQGCTLEQLVGFVYRLSCEPEALQVQSLVLTGSPRDQARWDMDLTLSCNAMGDATKEGH